MIIDKEEVRNDKLFVIIVIICIHNDHNFLRFLIISVIIIIIIVIKIHVCGCLPLNIGGSSRV